MRSATNGPLLRALSQPLRDWLRRVRTQWRYRHTRIDSSFLSPETKLGHDVWIAADACVAGASTIGDYSYLNGHAVIGFGHIGKFSSIGYGAMIGAQEHPTHLLSTSPFLYRPENILGNPSIYNDLAKPSEIGNDVWIGAHAVVRLGVRVGDGAIVGAGAVVTKDVPPYAIVAGMPAKIIRYRASPETIQRLLEWKWWDLPLDELRAVRELFASERWEELLAEQANRQRR